MNEQDKILAYNIIKKIITNHRRRHKAVVEHIMRLSVLDIDDIQNELFVEFLELIQKKEINHLATYLDRFCFHKLLNILGRFTNLKSGGKNLHCDEYDDTCNYFDDDKEEQILDFINKK